nr:glycoside hydrolase family 3 protein [Bacillus aquiflavi]
MFTHVHAEETNKVKDVIIYQNIPEVNLQTEAELQLKALHIYEDGHFKFTDGVKWNSSNKKVATVDEEGKVTFTGKGGKTFINLSAGQYKDRIAIHYKQAKKGRNAEIKVIKQKGKRYQIIDTAIKKMTIEEKVGQMLMPDFRKWNGKDVTEMLPEIESLVKQYHLGGVILFRENVVTTEQTTKLVFDYQQAAEKFGLLLAIDQEGGIVTRLQSGTDMPGNMALGATRSKELARNVGNGIGEELSALGFNMNLAPVLDVNNNPDNPVIGVRSFGENPELVAELGTAYINGLQETGVAATAKHFPGHGDTAVDSHLGLPEVPYDKERLMNVELYPFQKAMEAGIDAVMTAHITFPKIDDTKVISKKDGSEISLPATLSYKVLTELMREEMGYNSVIITDALNMNAIAEHFGPVDAVIRAVKAGTDIVLMPVGLEEVANGLLQAVDSGDISVARIEASVKRILTLKVQRGIIQSETPDDLEKKIENALSVVGSEAHKNIEREVANQSITLLKNNGALPLTITDEEKIVLIGNTFIESLTKAIKAYHPNTVEIKATGPLSEEQLELIKDAKTIIVGTYTFNVPGRSPDSDQMKLVNQIISQSEVPVIGVGIRNPYDIMAYPHIDGYLAQYGFREASFEATVATIFGENIPSGKLPVTIPDGLGNILYEYGHSLTY